MQYNTILRIICLIILICVLLLFVNVSEGYEDAVPKYCLTAGIKLSKGAVKYLKDVFKVDTDLEKVRLYTASECNKLEGAVYRNNECYKLKNSKKNKDGNYDMSSENIDIKYNEKCSGLNKLPSTLPSECSIDGALLGKMNKAFSINGKTPLVIDNNALRLYTKNECDKFKGSLELMSPSIEKLKGTKEDIDNYEKIHGKDYGICYSTVNPSLFCATDEAPTAASEVSDIMKKNIKGWLA